MAQQLAYLVLAYRSPTLLGQLTRWLAESSGDIHVHVDSQSDQTSFLEHSGDHSRFLPVRHSCAWGTWGRVAASIDLLRVALEGSATHFALISEDCFPLREPRNLSSALEASPEVLLMDSEKMGSASKPLSRVSRRNRFEGDPRSISILHKVLRHLPFSTQKVDWQSPLSNLAPHAGDSWWVITRKAAEEVLRFVNDEKEKMTFFESTWIADEHFFQTVLANSETPYIFSGSPMHADWDPAKSKYLPRFLNVDDVPDLIAAQESHLFARKLDRANSPLSSMVPDLWSSGTS